SAPASTTASARTSPAPSWARRWPSSPRERSACSSRASPRCRASAGSTGSTSCPCGSASAEPVEHGGAAEAPLVADLAAGKLTTLRQGDDGVRFRLEQLGNLVDRE